MCQTRRINKLCQILNGSYFTCHIYVRHQSAIHIRDNRAKCLWNSWCFQAITEYYATPSLVAWLYAYYSHPSRSTVQKTTRILESQNAIARDNNTYTTHWGQLFLSYMRIIAIMWYSLAYLSRYKINLKILFLISGVRWCAACRLSVLWPYHMGEYASAIFRICLVCLFYDAVFTFRNYSCPIHLPHTAVGRSQCKQDILKYIDMRTFPMHMWWAVNCALSAGAYNTGI